MMPQPAASSDAQARRAVTRYYHECERDYRRFWDLGSSLAMHYGFWEPGVRTLRQALRRQNERLAGEATVARIDRVLDAGCGVGGSAIHLARTRGCRVTGITLSPRQAASARRHAARLGVARHTHFLVMDYARTAFPDTSFDVVWAIESVCHAPDKRAFAREAARLLRPGGRLVLADGFAAVERYQGEDETVMRRWLSGWSVCGLETPARFRQHLHEAGFAAVRWTDATPLILPSARRLFRLSLYGWPIGRVSHALRLRTAVQLENISGARYQYRAFRERLGCYGIVSAVRAAT